MILISIFYQALGFFFFIIMLFYVQSFLFLGNKSTLIKKISVKKSKIAAILTLLEAQDLSNLALHLHYTSLELIKMFENRFSLNMYTNCVIYIIHLQ